MSVPGHEGISRAIHWLARHHADQPTLAEAARVAGMSPAHFSRSFHGRVGVSPKVFIKNLTLEDLKARLASGSGFLDVTLEAMSPGEFRRAGAGVSIRYGFHPTGGGEALVATTARGVCFLAFTPDTAARRRAMFELADSWPGAALAEDAAATRPVADSLRSKDPHMPFTLCVRGTNFQVQVWRALLRIPEGAVTTYSALAEAIGRPTAHRAVANAVGANPISWLIPCHRVVRTTGALGGYRWGSEAKRTLLTLESC